MSKRRYNEMITTLASIGISAESMSVDFQNSLRLASEDAPLIVTDEPKSEDEEDVEMDDNAKEEKVQEEAEVGRDMMKAILDGLDKCDYYLKKIVGNNSSIIETTGNFKKSDMLPTIDKAIDLIKLNYPEGDTRVENIETLYRLLSQRRMKKLSGGQSEPFIYEGYQLIFLESLWYMVSIIPASLDKNIPCAEIVQENASNLIVYQAYMKMLENITSKEYVDALGSFEFTVSGAPMSTPVSETPYTMMEDFQEYFISKEAAEFAGTDRYEGIIENQSKQLPLGFFAKWKLKRKSQKELKQIAQKMRESGIADGLAAKTNNWAIKYVDWATKTTGRKVVNFLLFGLLGNMICQIFSNKFLISEYIKFSHEFIPYIDNEIVKLDKEIKSIDTSNTIGTLEMENKVQAIRGLNELKAVILKHQETLKTASDAGLSLESASYLTAGESIINAMNIKNSGSPDIFLSIMHAITTTCEMLQGCTLAHRYQIITDTYGLMYETNAEVRRNKLEAIIKRNADIIINDITKRQGLQRGQRIDNIKNIF